MSRNLFYASCRLLFALPRHLDRAVDSPSTRSADLRFECASLIPGSPFEKALFISMTHAARTGVPGAVTTDDVTGSGADCSRGTATRCSPALAKFSLALPFAVGTVLQVVDYVPLTLNQLLSRAWAWLVTNH